MRALILASVFGIACSGNSASDGGVDGNSSLCPSAQPTDTGSCADPSCSWDGLSCLYSDKYGDNRCDCYTNINHLEPVWVCLPIECFAPDGECSPGAECVYDFEMSRYCNKQHHWVQCDGQGCYDPDNCDPTIAGGQCDPRNEACNYLPCYCEGSVLYCPDFSMPVDAGSD